MAKVRINQTSKHAIQGNSLLYFSIHAGLKHCFYLCAFLLLVPSSYTPPYPIVHLAWNIAPAPWQPRALPEQHSSFATSTAVHQSGRGCNNPRNRKDNVDLALLKRGGRNRGIRSHGRLKNSMQSGRQTFSEALLPLQSGMQTFLNDSVNNTVPFREAAGPSRPSSQEPSKELSKEEAPTVTSKSPSSTTCNAMSAARNKLALSMDCQQSSQLECDSRFSALHRSTKAPLEWIHRTNLRSLYRHYAPAYSSHTSNSLALRHGLDCYRHTAIGSIYHLCTRRHSTASL